MEPTCKYSYRSARSLRGGEGGIRTRGTLAGTPDFESGTFGHSDTSPPRNMSKQPPVVKRVLTLGTTKLPEDGAVAPLARTD